jgi:septal ring factor EnvC (AmiA/AmiB activator)
MEIDLIDTDTDIDKINKKLYFIETKLDNLESKIETIYQNTILINNNLNKNEVFLKRVLDDIWYFTRNMYVKIFM